MRRADIHENLTRDDPAAQTALTVLLFTSLAIASSVQVLADPLAGLLDRMVFSRAPLLRAEINPLSQLQGNAGQFFAGGLRLTLLASVYQSVNSLK